MLSIPRCNYQMFPMPRTKPSSTYICIPRTDVFDYDPVDRQMFSDTFPWNARKPEGFLCRWKVLAGKKVNTCSSQSWCVFTWKCQYKFLISQTTLAPSNEQVLFIYILYFIDCIFYYKRFVCDNHNFWFLFIRVLSKIILCFCSLFVCQSIKSIM